MNRNMHRISFAVIALAFVTVVPAAPEYHVLSQTKLGGEGGWDYLTVDGASRRLYISRGTHVMVVDADNQTIVGDIPDTAGVHGIAIAPKLGRGFTSNGRSNSVTIFDTKTLKKIGDVSVGERPDVIVFDPPSGRVFTFNGGTKDATALDAKSGKVVGTVKLGGKPEFAVSDGKGAMFVNLEDTSEIVKFDARKLEELARWKIAPGEEPSGLAMDRKSHRLFSACGNELMIVLNADTGAVVATPHIGRGPDGAEFDQSRGLAFSSNGADGTLTIVREAGADRFEVVANVPTRAGARTMALDPKTHRIFLVTAEVQASDENQSRRRSYVPGSFTLLVVGRE
jgi:YVTN family beta-propeller protein